MVPAGGCARGGPLDCGRGASIPAELGQHVASRRKSRIDGYRFLQMPDALGPLTLLLQPRANARRDGNGLIWHARSLLLSGRVHSRASHPITL